MITDQEEAQCRDAFELAMSVKGKWSFTRDPDGTYAAYSLNEFFTDWQEAFAAGLAARREPVMGEVYIRDPAKGIHDVMLKCPDADNCIGSFSTRERAEDYVAQFPKREGQEVGEPVGEYVGNIGNSKIASHGSIRYLAYQGQPLTPGDKLYTKPEPDDSSAESAPRCSQCGSDDVDTSHHEATALAPECWVKHCNNCTWSGEPE